MLKLFIKWQAKRLRWVTENRKPLDFVDGKKVGMDKGATHITFIGSAYIYIQHGIWVSCQLL